MSDRNVEVIDVSRDSRGPLGGLGLSARRLRYFYAAVTSGSIRGAADALDAEPSVVSRQIQLLEKELDAVLFERRGRGVVATEAAQLVLDHYRTCMSSQELLEAQLSQLRGIQQGRVLIAAGEGFANNLIDVAMNDFCREFPSITVSLELVSVVDVLRYVAEDRAHIGIAYGAPAGPEFRVVARKPHPVRVLARPDHALARADGPVALTELLGCSVGIMPPDYGLGQLARLAAFSDGVQLVPALTTNSISALKHYAMTGAGVVLLPEMAAMEELDDGRLVSIRTQSSALESAVAQLLLREGRVQLPVVDALVERLQGMNTLV